MSSQQSPPFGPLHTSMQALNILSLTFLFAPTVLRVLGIDDALLITTNHEYISSVKPFAPAMVLNLLFYEPLPVQAVVLGSWGTIHLPGLALDSVLGIGQGIILGADLLLLRSKVQREQKRRRMTTAAADDVLLLLPAVNLFLFAGMCASALPLHCLRDVDSTDGWPPDGREPHLLAQLLLWADILCTTSVPAILLLDCLAEGGSVPRRKVGSVLRLLLLVKAAATWAAVSARRRWAGFALHVASLVVYGSAIYAFMVLELIRQGRGLRGSGSSSMCLHSAPWLVAASACILVISGGSALGAVPLSRASGGAFDSLAGIFFGCRCGMVQYWAYARSRADCRRCERDSKMA